MAKPTVYYLSQAAKQIANLLPFIGTVVGFIGWVYNFIEVILIGTFEWLHDTIVTVDASGFSGSNLSGIEWIGYVNAVVPVSEMLSVLSAYYTAWLTVVLIRWAKSFIPTVAN
jgi:hypothetical protein